MPAKRGSEFDNIARGGSTRWTGKGPKPARHIPWPEVFKHHISVVEGHQRMIDMIRKHTVEGTADFRTIMACLNRANQMLKDTKEATRNFVEPAGTREAVPLGSASDSMYVGYSPADHEYGQAANEYGSKASKLRKNGIEEASTPDGSENTPGADERPNRKPPKDSRKSKGADSARWSSGANGIPVQERKPTQAPVMEDNPYFVIDSEPTPPQGVSEPAKPSKRGADIDSKPSKRSKLNHKIDSPAAEPETEDISAEVDARLAEKEQRRREKKTKKDNKRKRESDASPAAEVEETPPDDAMEVDDSEKVVKPKKKKSKKTKDDNEDAAEPADDETSEKPKEKRKKSKDKVPDADEEDGAKPKKSKKSKKDKKEKA